jgi:two-component system NtrC family sensor kinase
MRLIVTQLLQFARPTEYAGYVDSGAPRGGRRLPGAGRPPAGHDAHHVVRELRRHAQRRSTGNELQQVLVNLLVNAIHAMPRAARWSATRDADDGPCTSTWPTPAPAWRPS